ncbi:hypothetical protein [Bacillus testis]|uniref:hypothetical protein n=1 Tax=Bacillus testis TaxID=1622072 RepID=UPI00067EDE10|nr:hypothetical protein [Bacillus testis]
MRKQSMMGSSKYEFDTKQLDLDIQANIDRHRSMKESIRKEILAKLKQDAPRMEQTFSIYLEVLRDIKHEWKL